MLALQRQHAINVQLAAPYEVRFRHNADFPRASAVLGSGEYAKI
jgi:hypothetical protein